ncbi:hypothetical protein RE628_18910 [Paenibacillus sp. D2_2]|uniref:hypothetical protein n=1 Tax=Paenibacillus sp. D2_2 TaxID=3073092 RepID=UPI0028157CC8|nr:hypothetical protein [Paenibacillus sp. D2_2]WMT39484.1 hypothetical protein RE628_18910 [Paenibacillus sp. D2_2]
MDMGLNSSGLMGNIKSIPRIQKPMRLSIKLDSKKKFASYTKRVLIDGVEPQLNTPVATLDENNRLLVPFSVAKSAAAKLNKTPEITSASLQGSMINKNGVQYVLLDSLKEMLGLSIENDRYGMTINLITSPNPDSKVDSTNRLIRTTNLPKNSGSFPYILQNVPNSMYEMTFPTSKNKNKKNSAQLWKNDDSLSVFVTDEDVNEWARTVSTYYDLMLNVDYRTINYQWADEVFPLLSGNYNETYMKGQIRSYVDWVKKNKIVMRGYAKPEPSIIYNPGGNNLYYIRTTFSYEILQANSSKYITPSPSAKIITKPKKGIVGKYELYYDVPLTYPLWFSLNNDRKSIRAGNTELMNIYYHSQLFETPWEEVAG